jgi:hypothetical protein
MKFLKRTAGHTKLDKKRIRELKINSVLEHRPIQEQLETTYAKNGPESYSSTNDDLSYPTPSLGRPLKRWRETATGH